MKKLLGPCFIISLLTACTNLSTSPSYNAHNNSSWPYRDFSPSEFAAYEQDYTSRVPQEIETKSTKVVLVDPKNHTWGAYSNGKLIRAGIATSGGPVCPPDAVNESDCRTNAGTYKITSMGDRKCASKKYPQPNGGGLMPYCMYFNNGQALHGSPDDIVVEDNLSHGCVRMRIPDAEWMRYNFASVGTKVMVLPY